MSATMIIEGVEIPERLIADEAQHHPRGDAAESRLAAARALAVKALLLNRAAELGLAATPEFDAAPPFEVARARIAEGLERRAWMSAAAKYVADLAADARGRGVALSLIEEGAPRAGSITLGGLMADALGERLSAWLTACDPALAGKAAAAARAQDLATEEFVRRAFRAFVETANDEAWTRVISAAQGADDPALACLTAVLKAKLDPARTFRTVLRRK